MESRNKSLLEFEEIFAVESSKSTDKLSFADLLGSTIIVMFEPLLLVVVFC